MYSTHNEEKSAVAEKFLKTLKNKIDKYVTSISKNVQINKVDDVVNKYNNTYHPRTTRMKRVDVKSSAYIDSSQGIINWDPEFKVGDTVRISIYKKNCKRLCSKLIRIRFCN